MDPDSANDELSESLPDFYEHEQIITLTHTPPIWTLPASSARCLEAMLYLRMCKIPFTKKASSYFKSAKGELPHLHQFRHVHGADSYMNFLKENNPKGNLDADLKTHEQVLANALSAHVQHSLTLLTSYMLWMEADNLKHTQNAMGAPLSVFVRKLFLRTEQKDVAARCQQAGYLDRESVLKALAQILSDLSTQLGDQKYFFGDECSSLDATVGGNLLFLFYNDLPVNYTSELKIDISNLKAFAYRMLCSFLRDTFFEEPLEVDAYLELRRAERENEEADDSEQQEDEEEEKEDEEEEKTSIIDFDERKKSWLFLAGSVATVVFYIGWYKNIRGIKIEIQ